jgi:peroxiredoxin
MKRYRFSDHLSLIAAILLLAPHPARVCAQDAPVHYPSYLHVAVGNKAPDFVLPASDGEDVQLSSFEGRNVLIDFYRGYWCPYCMTELGELVKHYREFQALDVQVLAVSVDPPEKAAVARERVKAPFPVLSDFKRQIIAIYGTDSETDKGPDGGVISAPTLILIDKTGTIRWIHQDQDITSPIPVAAVLAEARKLKPSTSK